MDARLNLTKAELQAPFAGEMGQLFPIIMSPEVFAKLLGRKVKTVRGWMSQGRLDGCYRKRGKHCLIWRDRALATIFNGPKWE